MDMAAEGITADSIFIQNSRPIKFVVNRISISDQDREWITDVLIPELQRLGDRGIVFGRAAASPEGPYDNNRRLANQRRASVDALLRSYGIGTDHIQYDVVAEDYDLLYTMMMLKHDAKFHDVDSLITLYANDTQRLKAAMKRHDGGKLWRYLLKEYFPKLRAVRIIVVDKRLANIDSNDMAPRPIAATIPATVADCHLRIQNADITPAHIIPATTPASALPRREVLSVKSNVLFDFAYMPGYDRFCPIPNVALEYYPLHGHFTYGASFDCPWWQHYDEHKYFQVRNYQLHTRYYLRSGDIRKRKPGEGAAFRGLYLSLYAHAYLYNICFDEKRGWEGEGWGAGFGIGYVVPLGRSGHWKLEFGLQAGYLSTNYDPYQWKCPVDPDTDKEQYYYKWYGNANDFQKRQHRFSWLGPTRVEITLSYDLLYRRNNKKGVSSTIRQNIATMRNITKLISRIILDASRKACNKAAVMCFALLCLVATGCVREPKLHLHQGGADIDMEIPTVDLDLKVIWNYIFQVRHRIRLASGVDLRMGQHRRGNVRHYRLHRA